MKILMKLKWAFFSSVLKKGKILEVSRGLNYYTKEKEKISLLTSFFGYNADCRLPGSIVNNMSSKMKRLNRCLCGEKISFYTNSTCIDFELLYSDIMYTANMSLVGVAGVDIYYYDNEYHWVGSVYPNNIMDIRVKKRVNFPKGMKKIDVFLPSYAVIQNMNICCPDSCVIKQYCCKEKKKIIIYGSSISQGCAASRPGLTYSGIISRELNYKVINLGFSESALGQYEIVQYMSKLNGAIYIIEYDHNASLKRLRETHMSLYTIIRKNNQDAMILFLSRISGGFSISMEEEDERLKIINSTIIEAVKIGDKNVRFICGRDLFADKERLLADDRHPNDYGMRILADSIVEIIRNERCI